MMKDDLLYFGHMLDTARKIQVAMSGVGWEAYDANEVLRAALTHWLQIIGEAARHVSADGRRDHPEIPWQDITGLRHRIVHDYFAINDDVIWDIVRIHVPVLISALEVFLAPLDPDQPDH